MQPTAATPGAPRQAPAAWAASCRDELSRAPAWVAVADLIRDGKVAATLLRQAAGLLLTSARAESLASWQALHDGVRAWDGRDLQDLFDAARRDVADALAQAELTAGTRHRYAVLVTADLLLEAVKFAARCQTLRARQPTDERVPGPGIRPAPARSTRLSSWDSWPASSSALCWWPRPSWGLGFSSGGLTAIGKRRSAWALMTLPHFLTGLELELRLPAVPFDRGQLETWAANVWPLAEDDPDVICWAEAFLAVRQEAAGA